LNNVIPDSISIDSKFFRLAYWMKTNYGSTMNKALKTVLPVKRSIKRTTNKRVRLIVTPREALELAEKYRAGRSTAQAKVLSALSLQKEGDYTGLMKECGVSAQTFTSLKNKGLIDIYSSENFRTDLNVVPDFRKEVTLNEEQKQVAEGIIREWDMGDNTTCLIKGVTGSGKTEVYMDIISHVLAKGRQVIVLIPEIGLTYQSVMRFYHRFGDMVSVIHSRLSEGEKYDRFELARQGRIRIMIGPRTALFTPFPDLGLIIIDEEHERAYKSDSTPMYHARETAEYLAALCDAKVVLGSATPSLKSYYNARKGIYNLYELNSRAGSKSMPAVCVVDLKEELKRGNQYILSNTLAEKMYYALQRKEQIILFLNRRGYQNFVSCRSCGSVIECPHCAVSLKLHNNNRLMCHYCGYETEFVRRCPVCNSKQIGSFNAGTEKAEEHVRKFFPQARVLRMDTDTTRGKTGHEDILKEFQAGNADILIGTQMIAKGHDFPNVTLVGILVADTSLYCSDYTCAEKTFDLIMQASGRAGRGRIPGEVVIQSYDTEHYAVRCAAKQSYEAFYEAEMEYRELMDYPPAVNMMSVRIISKDEQTAVAVSKQIKELTDGCDSRIIGPANDLIYKLNDFYHRVIYYKNKENKHLTQIKDIIEKYSEDNPEMFKNCQIQFDFE
ncbi:MAG: primosomal protein N', partial [Butyrivibrio sp.]